MTPAGKPKREEKDRKQGQNKPKSGDCRGKERDNLVLALVLNLLLQDLGLELHNSVNFRFLEFWKGGYWLLGYFGIIINAAHLRGQPPPKHCLPDKSGLF